VTQPKYRMQAQARAAEPGGAIPPARPPLGFDGMLLAPAHGRIFPSASAARSVLSMISGDFHLNRPVVAVQTIEGSSPHAERLTWYGQGGPS